jgi:hypothetical protein
LIKTLKKLGIPRMYLNTIKIIHDKLITKIVLNGENLKHVLRKSGMRQGVSVLSHCSVWVLS